MVGVPLDVEAGDTLPQGPVGHDTDQLTPLAVESLLTVAVKLAVAPASTVAAVWESDTVRGPLLLLLLPPPPPHAQSIRTGITRAAYKVASGLCAENRSLTRCRSEGGTWIALMSVTASPWPVCRTSGARQLPANVTVATAVTPVFWIVAEVIFTVSPLEGTVAGAV